MYFYAESYVAKKLIELSEYSVKNCFDAAAEISGVEAVTGLTLAKNQREAVEEALLSGVLVITGGPGTGKTTIINTIIKLLKKDDYLIELAAPTGRAAKRMTETTGYEAKTVHRLLGVTFSDESGKRQSFEKNEDAPVDADVIIVDESSMIDIMLMYHLLKAVKPGTKLIFVGDADQLPSVGPGNVLRDIISSGIIKTVKLNEIFRQDQESAIIINAHRINHGEYPVFNDAKDFFLVRRNNADDVFKTIIDLIKHRLPTHYKLDSNRDIQLLSPMRRGQIGINSLNAALQEALNPPAPGKNEKNRGTTVFREKDKIIQIKNHSNVNWKTITRGKLQEEGQGIFNGDEGIITDIDNTRETLTALFDGSRQVIYDFSQLDELELAYAITVHKSQGSEYDTVVLPVHSGPYMLMNRNILYTAVTRAKKLVVLVGTEDALRGMVDNNREIERYSTLAYRIVKIYDAIGSKAGGGIA
jgi:exodeoxyribonuclease V alpha subunit